MNNEDHVELTEFEWHAPPSPPNPRLLDLAAEILGVHPSKLPGLAIGLGLAAPTDPLVAGEAESVAPTEAPDLDAAPAAD